MARLGLIVNPTSGKNTGARIGTEALTLLRAAGVDILDLSAADARSAMEQGRAAIGGGAVDRIVVAGGDGMVHLGANLCAGTGVPLGIIAAGTGNDIARELGLPVRDAAKAVERILDGGTRRRGRGPAHRWRRVRTAGSWACSRPGSTRVVNERANQWRWPKGPMRYNLAIMRELPLFRAIPYVLELDGTRMETEAMLVAVGNGPSYGGGMRVTPDAEFDDGLLDVLVLHKISTAGVPAGLPDRCSRAPTSPTRRCRCCGPARCGWRPPASSSYADGERFAPLPMTHGGRARRAHRPGLSADVA